MRMRTQNGIGQGENPGKDPACFPTEQEMGRGFLYQESCIRVVGGRERMSNSFAPRARFFIPAGCASVQVRHPFWLANHQPGEDRLTKEIMIAIPLPLCIQWDQEEIGLFQLL